MLEVRQLGPQEAALVVLNHIRDDPVRLDALQRAPKIGSDFYVGNTALHEVYGTPLEGISNILDDAFRKKIYRPIGFEVVALQLEDAPSDASMVAYLGKLIKQLIGD